MWLTTSAGLGPAAGLQITSPYSSVLAPHGDSADLPILIIHCLDVTARRDLVLQKALLYCQLSSNRMYASKMALAMSKYRSMAPFSAAAFGAKVASSGAATAAGLGRLLLTRDSIDRLRRHRPRKRATTAVAAVLSPFDTVTHRR